ncbi:hypothetical protein C8F01DRAFT_1258610 [Mycena amicta]|nr:hypothetical protein C8F01DRAFT_1258610 [Mycena amicta]
MSTQAAHSDASTTTSDFFAGSYDSSASGGEDSSAKGSPRDTRPMGLLVPRGLSPVLKEVNIAVYPWIWSHRQLTPVGLDTISPTLRGSGTRSLDHLGFICNPLACDVCSKPFFVHPRLPDFMFTVLCECPHFGHIAADRPDAYPQTSMRNKAISRLVPLNAPVVQGAVIIVKHPRVANGALNIDCAIANLLVSDLPICDLIVVRWAREFAQDPANQIFFKHPLTRGPSATGPFPGWDGASEAAQDRLLADAAGAEEMALLGLNEE